MEWDKIKMFHFVPSYFK